MAFETQTKQVLISGANVVVRVNSTPGGAGSTVLGLVSQASYNENFQIQKANVLGHLGPISMDPQDYSCEITIGAFAARIPVDVPEGSDTEIAPWVPSRGKALDDNAKFPYLDFYDLGTQEVIEAFSGVIVASSGKQIEGGGYVRVNVQLQALERVTNLQANA